MMYCLENSRYINSEIIKKILKQKLQVSSNYIALIALFLVRINCLVLLKNIFDCNGQLFVVAVFPPSRMS